MPILNINPNILFTLILVIVTFFGFANTAHANSQKDITVVAEVDGEIITLSELEEAAIGSSKKSWSELDESSKLSIIENKIAERLLYKEALNKKLNEDPDIIKALEAANRGALIKRLIDLEITSKMPTPTLDEVTAYYEKNKAIYSTPEEADIEYLNVLKSTVIEPTTQDGKLVWTTKGKRVEEEARKVAQDIKEAILKGEDINEIINRYRSLDPAKTPWVDQKQRSIVAKGRYYKTMNFDEIVFNLKEGEVGTFELSDRIMIIKMIKRMPGSLQALKDIEPKVLNRLKEEIWATRYNNFIDSLKNSTKITYKYDITKGQLTESPNNQNIIVAEVGNEKITLNEFIDTAKRTFTMRLIELTIHDKVNILERLIAEKLLHQESLNRRLDKDPNVSKTFEKTKRGILAKNLVDREITSKIPSPTPKEIAAYFEEKKADYTMPAKAGIEFINVYKSFVPVARQTNQPIITTNKAEEEARKVAQNIKEALSAGKDFNEIIKNYKTSASENNPWIDEVSAGEISKGMLFKNTNFDEIVFNLQEGEVGTFELSDRIMVIKVLKRIPAITQPLQDVEPAILGRLKEEIFAATYKDYLSRLKESSKIILHYK